MVRHGDDQWFDIVKWTLFALVTTEELGITSKNVDEKAKAENPELKRVLGTDGNFGEQLGLTKDWVIRIVKLVGNYGEAYEDSSARNVLPVYRGRMRIGRLSPDFAELQSTGPMSGLAARLPGSKDDEGSSGYLPDWPEHAA